MRHIFNLELRGAEPNAVGDASSDDGDTDAGLAEEVDAEAVLDVVALELEGRAVDGTEVDAAVSENAVDVDTDEPDCARRSRVDGCGRYRRVRSHSWIKRSTRASSLSRGIMFGPSLGA